MNKLFLALSFSAFALTAYAQQPTMTEWHDLQVNEVNRFTPHTDFFTYEPVTRRSPKTSFRLTVRGVSCGWSMPTSVLQTALVQTITTVGGH